MRTIRQEPFAQFMDELKPLLDVHWREVAHYEDIPLNPDYGFYCSSPALRCMTVRDDGELTGYAIYGVGRNKHYMDSVQSVQDVLFVHPKHRGFAGKRLIRASDAMLKAEGVQVSYHHVKKAHPVLGRLLVSEGYEVVEEIYAKRLDKG
jgi:hypothetical protein